MPKFIKDDNFKELAYDGYTANLYYTSSPQTLIENLRNYKLSKKMEKCMFCINTGDISMKQVPKEYWQCGITKKDSLVTYGQSLKDGELS